jgi:transposase
MIKFFIEVVQMNSENIHAIDEISEILNYENLKMFDILITLKEETTEDSLLKYMILNYVYPDKSEKQIIKDLKKYVEKEKMSKK